MRRSRSHSSPLNNVARASRPCFHRQDAGATLVEAIRRRGEPMGLTRLIEVDRCREGGGVFVECGGRELAVFRLDDGAMAVTDNSCPHASGNLSGGALAGSVVTCPWHDWDFDVTTGLCTQSHAAKVSCYPVTIRDGVVFVDLGSPY